MLVDCQESSRSLFKRSASLATERRQTLVAWATMVNKTDRRWPVTPEDLPTPESLLTFFLSLKYILHFHLHFSFSHIHIYSINSFSFSSRVQLKTLASF